MFFTTLVNGSMQEAVHFNTEKMTVHYKLLSCGNCSYVQKLEESDS